MKPTRFFIALAFACSATGAATMPPGPADREALTSLAQHLDVAWDNKDAARLSSYFSRNGSLKITGMERPVSGSTDLHAHFRQVFAERATTLRHVTQLKNIELLGDDVAIADATVLIERKNADGSWSPVSAFLSNSVAVRETGGWKFGAVRGHALPAGGGAK